jgi:hypothetical protein
MWSYLYFVTLFIVSFVRNNEVSAWEYEAVYHIEEHTDEYTINLSNFADPSMVSTFSVSIFLPSRDLYIFSPAN